MTPTPEDIRAACDQLSREMQSGPFRAALEAVVRATDAAPASSCTNPDTDEGGRDGARVGCCNSCGWESAPFASAEAVGHAMEAHRIEANERWRAAAVSALELKAYSHYCEGCERSSDDDGFALPLLAAAGDGTEWCPACIAEMPADVLRRYWPDAIG